MRNTKIMLIHPLFTEEEASGKTKSMKKVMNIIPPLGIAYILAVLERDGFHAEMVDCSTGISNKQLRNILKKEMPNIVGLTSTTPSLGSSAYTARLIRDTLPDSLIVLGGCHVTALPAETLKTGLFDIGVMGEGELTFLELAQYYEKNNGKIDHKDLKKIKGIAFKDKNNIIINKRREFIKDLDSIPFPARHLLPPLSKYHPTPASYRKLPQAHVMTTRGCPNLCTFCDKAIFGCSYRERSSKNVLEEIDLLIKNYGVKEIKFFDDTFTINKKRLYEICDGMEKRKLGWCCLTKVNAVTKDVLAKMKKSGCWQVLYGLESGDGRMLKLLKKGNTVEQNERAVRWAQEVGLNVRADFIVGTPGETKESIKKTIEFAKKLNVDFAHFNKFTPYPGTQLYCNLIKQGFKFDFTKNCSQLDHSETLYVPDGINKKEYLGIIDLAYKEYYLRPRYLLKQMLSIRSFEDIKRFYNGFFAIFNL